MSGQNSQRLDVCKKEADIMIINDGTKEEFYQKLDKLLTELFT
jgi:hypothetical protein